ncbi:hypothetical protein WICPIJ_008868 [Wickerhamomyces pijperi]|uniref:Uncharacterized protein n=1 Tax=Wickerhamomyces pijperi TaxID=599730 RepID=A0A9P8PU02_WICPI|nr:hypothetical protein WICPIJ_008868 [Wickerhamomyces pijperi]
MPSIQTKATGKSLIVTFKYNPNSRSPRRRSNTKINTSTQLHSELKSPLPSSPDQQATKNTTNNNNMLTPPVSQQSNSLPSTHKLSSLILQVEEELSQDRDVTETFSDRYSNTDFNPLTGVLVNISKFSKISSSADADWFDQSNTVITNLRLWKTVYRALEQKKRAIKKESTLQKTNTDEDEDHDQLSRSQQSGPFSNNAEKPLNESSDDSTNNQSQDGFKADDGSDLGRAGARRKRTLRV